MVAYKTGCLIIGDKVKFEHKGKDYDAVFKTINNKLRLVYVDHECRSFAEFIRKVTDYTILDETQYSNLKINDVSWKDFCEKVIFMESVMSIKNELQSIPNDLNVRDIFFGTESPHYNVKKLYIVVNNTPAMKLQVIGEFQIIYIEWGIFTETVPRNLSPEKPIPLDIKKKFDNFLDTTLGIKFSSKHSNINAISLGWKIFKGEYIDTPAIIFHVIRKGVIPLGSEILPQEIYGIKTDIREGFYDACGLRDALFCQGYMERFSPGCSIGITSCNTRAGTLGAFVENKIGSNGNIYLLSNDHILRLNDGNEEKSIVRQPAYKDYEEVTYREIEGEKCLLKRAQRDKKYEETKKRTKRIEKLENKLERRKEKKTEFAKFVNGIRDNYKIDNKLYGVDAAIALVDDPDKKLSINPKDVAIPESEFKVQSLKPIMLSGIRDVNLIETSDCVFKVGRATGLTKGRIDETLTTILDGDFRIYEQQLPIFRDVFIEKIEIEGRILFPPIRLDRQILVKRADDGMFMQKGDSGCVWFDQEGKIIALGHGTLHVNNLNSVYGIGSPINAVLESLGVKPYFGS